MTNNTEQQAVPVAQSPASIWLSPICDETADHSEGRTWASPAPDAECEDCGLPWVEYVRADLAPVSDATQTREAEGVSVDDARAALFHLEVFAEGEESKRIRVVIDALSRLTGVEQAARRVLDDIDDCRSANVSVADLRAALNVRGGA